MEGKTGRYTGTITVSVKFDCFKNYTQENMPWYISRDCSSVRPTVLAFEYEVQKDKKKEKEYIVICTFSLGNRMPYIDKGKNIKIEDCEILYSY